MDYLSEEGLSTYDAQIKGYVNAQMAQRSEIPSSQMAVINDIDANVDTILANYVTTTALQNALANVGGGEVITINVANAGTNCYVKAMSGTTTLNADLADGDTITVPFGVEYTISAYNASDLLLYSYTATAAKMSSTVSVDMANGYGTVDLGLSSGTLWAATNIGANAPQEYGLYFSWGNTVEHAQGSGYNFDSTTYSSTSGSRLSTSIVAGSSNDAARVNMGSCWQMPTKTQYEELMNSCTWTWTTMSGVNGYKVSGTNGNSIFLPASGYYYGTSLYDSGSIGYYWSTEYHSSSDAYYQYFSSSSKSMYHSNRFCGQSIRAVRSPQS